ncbi:MULTISPECIES: hypothetical protein [unclassified Aerococcus]|uniref:hypothetical protein n=1 Tax=unclassified Aerococcus TaxID=2618060 RepID=UPI0025B816BE|nr:MULTISPECIES: hypothetical protein [unclassified Aerococcus]
MKKEKLFNIDLVNKSSVQIVKNTTTFYTSDTELWLGFELLEKEHTFDSAEILLLNKDDRSFIVRSVTQGQDKYWYELESDIIAHYGEWIGQLQFTKDGEVFTSKQFAFRIENDLSNDRPPQLTEVNNWKNLRTIADGLIDDIRVELESLAKQELEIANAETTRQSAEQQRIEAETLRVENETKRELEINKIRNEVFNNTKIKLVNLVENGDFSDGLLGWKSHQGGVIEVVDSRLKIDTSPTNYSGVSQPINVKYDTNDIIYTNVSVYNPNDHDITLNFQYASRTNLVKISPTFNGVVSVVQTSDTSMLSPRYFITKNSISDQYSFFIDNVILLNLTKIFGAGNEPTKETMDWIINTNGYFDELAIVRDDIQQYEINQLRKAVLALGGTI